MKFSIYLNPQTRGPAEDVPIIETTVEQAVRATTAGVSAIALTEHHFSGYNTYGNNFMLAAHLAPQVPASTTFLLACAVPPLHNPMRLAQNCNLLDVLTKGNLIDIEADPANLQFDMPVRMVFRGAELANAEGARLRLVRNGSGPVFELALL